MSSKRVDSAPDGARVIRVQHWLVPGNLGYTVICYALENGFEDIRWVEQNVHTDSSSLNKIVREYRTDRLGGSAHGQAMANMAITERMLRNAGGVILERDSEK